MSLIVATNSVNENDGRLDDSTSSNFSNFFRSPIVVPPNSEIAVESIKINRTGNITIKNNDFFCHYFGRDPSTLPELEESSYLNSISRTIALKRGSYNLDEYVKQINSQTNKQYADPRIFNNASITLNTATDGAEEGLNIKFTQRGSASNSNLSGSLAGSPVFNLENPWDVENGSRLKPSDKFTYTPGTGVFARTGTAAATSSGLFNSSCVGILMSNGTGATNKGKPFGLNEGRFDIGSLANASARDWAIGLSRPQVQFTLEEPVDKVFDLDYNTAPRVRQGLKIIDEGGNQDLLGSTEIYDYAVMSLTADNGSKFVTVVQRAYDEFNQVSRHEEVAYWDTTGGLGAGTGGDRWSFSEFYASFDGIRFQGAGDEVKLFFKNKGLTTYAQVLGGNLDKTPGRSFTPIGDTSYALYPMLNLGAGSVTITKYESNYTHAVSNITNYQAPYYLSSTKQYHPGSDMFSNEAPSVLPGLEQRYARNPDRRLTGDGSATSGGDDAVRKIDSSATKFLWSEVDTNLTDYAFVGLNASKGVQYEHQLTVNKFTGFSEYDSLVSSQAFPNMATRLGFPDRALLLEDEGQTEGYVTVATGGNIVTFTSTAELDKTTGSSFVRIPGLTHKSFNGAQSGISKILYHLPQFANDGRQYGPLYFAPGEKTYIDLNNPAPILLNSLQVQIVDEQEKIINSLNGITQVVFHIKEKSK